MGHTFAHSPQLVHLSRSTNRASCFTTALKFPGSPLRSMMSEFVSNSMFKCRPTSTSFGEITHIAQSLVGNVLSSCDIIPPIAEDFSSR